MKALGAAVPAWLQGLRDAPRVIDGVLPDPLAFRAAVLERPMQSIAGGDQVFHGIRLPDGLIVQALLDMLAVHVPSASCAVTFARQSPAGQIEPNDVHSDAMMGDLTGILYLNPEPVAGDGTRFWRRKATGAVRGVWDVDCQADSHDRDAWECWRHVDAHFNRLLLFRSDYFHSRAMVENFGVGDDDARLIQVLFLTDRVAGGVAGV